MKLKFSGSRQSEKVWDPTIPAAQVVPLESLGKLSLLPCPEDVLTPREIVGYLRAMEEGTELPAEVEEHLASCGACQNNWAFVLATEPKLRQVREKRVKLLIRQVQAEEEVERSSLDSVKRHASESRPLVKDFEKALFESTRDDEVKWIEKLWPDDDAAITVDKALELSKRVQEMDGNERRFLAAKRLSSLFEGFIKRKVDRELGWKILDLLISSKLEVVDLSQLGVTLDTAAAFVASLPHASYFREPILMERSGNTVLFHRRRFSDVRAEFDRIRAAFEAPAPIEAHRSRR